MVYSLLYVSSATVLFDKAALEQLLIKARDTNARLGVTGMLLYKGGNFMQVLEGDERTVQSLYNRITADARHKGTIVLLKNHVAERSFDDWSMAFRNLDEPGERPAGYSDFLNTPLTADAFSSDPTKAERLLLMFKAKM